MLFFFPFLSTLSFFFFFFFQAEDGIRDATVTGVQTCALPIFLYQRSAHHGGRPESLGFPFRAAAVDQTVDKADAAQGAGHRLRRFPDGAAARSEERRVGKEWRCVGGREYEERKNGTKGAEREK